MSTERKITNHSREGRPDPEELLKAIQKEESRLGKGKLKIFLGMAAGVGKTFTMLKEAQRLRSEGQNPVVVVVETHGRAETEELLQGLDVIPMISVPYRGRDFKELDLDAVLARNPQLVLIDELAHTNVPGLRHTKRWQDVLEILEHGIDVYTTLNIQHIESLNDVIDGITGISVKETVPDSIIDLASSIQLVDITPEDLLQRLREGKVYLGDQSKIAAKNFFQKEPLTALREISLRYAADKIDHDLHGMERQGEAEVSWKPREKLLVAVSHSPHSQKLIRATRRLASTLDAPWVAVHVDNGRHLTESESTLLSKNLDLARDLGAEVITTSDPSIPMGIERVAHGAGVTQIIVGRSPEHGPFSLFHKSSILEQLAEECSDIDVHVLSKEPDQESYKRKLFTFSWPEPTWQYIAVFSYVMLIFGVDLLLLPYVGYQVVGVTFLVGLLFLSLFVKRGPLLFASLQYAFLWSYYFIPPIRTQKSDKIEDIAILCIYFLTALVTGALVHQRASSEQPDRPALFGSFALLVSL